MSEMKETAYDVVEDSAGTLADEKRYAKEMNDILKDAAKECNVSKSLIKRMMNYAHYKKSGWVGNDPLTLDPQVEIKDKMSLVFIKFVNLLQDVKSAGMDDILNEYIEKLKSIGILIDFSGLNPPEVASDSYRVQESIESASKLLDRIIFLSNKISKEDAVKAEELGFGPKNEYSKLVKLYAKKKDGKEIDDEIQQIQTNLLFAQTSYSQVANDTVGTN